MSRRTFSSPLLISVLALMWMGAFVSENSVSDLSFALVGTLQALAWFAQHLIHGERFFFSERNFEQNQNPTFFYRGENLPLEEAERSEVTLLRRLLSFRRVIVRRLLAVGLLSVYVLVTVKMHRAPFTFFGLLHVAIAGIFIYSATLNQIVSVLTCELVTVAFYIAKSDQLFSIKSLLFFTTFLIVLVIHRKHWTACIWQKNDHRWPSITVPEIKKAASIVCGILILALVLDAFLPVAKKPQEVPPAPFGMRGLQSLNRVAGQSLRLAQEQRKASDAKSDSAGIEGRKNVGQREFLESSRNLEHSSRQSKEEFAVPNSKATGRISDPHENQKAAEEQRFAESEKSQRTLTRELNTMNPSVSELRNLAAKNEEGGGDRAPDSGQVEKPGASSSQNIARNSGALDQAVERQGSERQAGSNSGTPKIPEAEHKPESAPVELLSQSQLENLWFVLKILAFVFGAWFILKSATKRHRKSNSKDAVISRAERDKLALKWYQIEKQKMTPGEEVIAKYRFFLETMETTPHPRPDSMSPENYQIEVTNYYPNLNQDLRQITGLFCDVLYGQFEIAPQRLSEFRTSILRVVSRIGPGIV